MKVIEDLLAKYSPSESISNSEIPNQLIGVNEGSVSKKPLELLPLGNQDSNHSSAQSAIIAEL